jgi:hypothetical protein
VSKAKAVRAPTVKRSAEKVRKQNSKKVIKKTARSR